MKILIIALCLVVLQSTQNEAYSEVNTDFEEIKREFNIQKGDYFVMIFFDLGACEKYIFTPLGIVNCLKEKVGDVKVKFSAFVSVSREKELAIFKKNYSWNYDCHRDKDYKEKLGLKRSAAVAVFDSEGNTISEMKLFDINCDKLMTDLEEYNKLYKP